MSDRAEPRRYVDITPTPQGLDRMRAVMTDSIQSYTKQITQIETFLERITDHAETVFCDYGANNEEVDWVQEGLQLLVQKKESSITVLQGGIAEITRCLTPPVDTPDDGTPPPPP